MISYNTNLKIFQSSLINDATFISGFSTKDLGDSLKIENIEKFFAANNIPVKKIVILQQIHSINIVKYENNLSTFKIQKIENTDGIITHQYHTVIIVRTADCVPLLMTDKVKGIIGASHQGWRGSLKNMAEKMISNFIQLGSNPESIKCAIGPAIGICCYEIDNELSYEFLAEYEEYSKQIISYKRGKPHLSLNHLNYLQLIKAGVKKENIDFFPFCTKCNSERFFSRRRSKSNDFGEMFSFVIIKF